jgi:hypothetical protein
LTRRPAHLGGGDPRDQRHICTASSLARFYAGLIGEVDGVRYNLTL